MEYTYQKSDQIYLWWLDIRPILNALYLMYLNISTTFYIVCKYVSKLDIIILDIIPAVSSNFERSYLYILCYTDEN